MRIKNILLLLALTFLPTLAKAQLDAATMLQFNVEVDGNATITGMGRSNSPTLTIPSTVTSGASTFNVTAIDIQAFIGNTSLTGLDLSQATNLEEIRQQAFASCTKLTGTLTLPSSLKRIGSLAFDGCSSLTGGLTLPSGLTTIDLGAFQNCSGFTGKLTIPNGMTIISSHAFFGCSGLTSELAIPNSITSIGDQAFAHCSGFTGKLTLPSGLTSIETSTFNGCSGLTGTLTIPNGVTSIGFAAFLGCSRLTGDVVIPSATDTIGDMVFSSCAGVRSMTINSPAIGMGFDVFEGCKNLEYIDMSQVQTITGLSSLSRSISLTAGHAFSGLPAHTVVYLPQGIPDSLVTNAAPNNMNYVRLDKTGVDQCAWLYVQDGENYYIPNAFTAARATWNAAGTGAETAPNATRTSFSRNATAYLPFDFTLGTSGLKGYTLLDKKNTPGRVFRFRQQAATFEYKANTPYLIRSEAETAVAGIDVTSAIGIDVPATPVSGMGLDAGGVPTGDYIGTPVIETVGNPNCATTITDPASGTWGFYGTTEHIDNNHAATAWNAYVLASSAWHPFANDGSSALAPLRAFMASLNGAVGSKPDFTMEYVNLDGSTTGISGLGNEPVNSVETRIYNTCGQYVGKDLNALPKGLYVVNGKKVIK